MVDHHTAGDVDVAEADVARALQAHNEIHGRVRVGRCELPDGHREPLVEHLFAFALGKVRRGGDAALVRSRPCAPAHVGDVRSVGNHAVHQAHRFTALWGGRRSHAATTVDA